mmetsp:Transcript_42326/g.47298  ORF Transcript_42326/g.47298 Transcript_42326/m.47298 type:complete len:455 (+) Transcript_42326:222-1586(+)
MIPDTQANQKTKRCKATAANTAAKARWRKNPDNRKKERAYDRSAPRRAARRTLVRTRVGRSPIIDNIGNNDALVKISTHQCKVLDRQGLLMQAQIEKVGAPNQLVIAESTRAPPTAAQSTSQQITFSNKDTNGTGTGTVLNPGQSFCQDPAAGFDVDANANHDDSRTHDGNQSMIPADQPIIAGSTRAVVPSPASLDDQPFIARKASRDAPEVPPSGPPLYYGNPMGMGASPSIDPPLMRASPFSAQLPVATSLVAGYGQQPSAQGRSGGSGDGLTDSCMSMSPLADAPGVPPPVPLPSSPNHYDGRHVASLAPIQPMTSHLVGGTATPSSYEKFKGAPLVAGLPPQQQHPNAGSFGETGQHDFAGSTRAVELQPPPRDHILRNMSIRAAIEMYKSIGTAESISTARFLNTERRLFLRIKLFKNGTDDVKIKKNIRRKEKRRIRSKKCSSEQGS